MNFLVVYCNHDSASLDIRERLAFPDAPAAERAYRQWSERHSEHELVLISTCNRVELYVASEGAGAWITAAQLAQFLSEYHQLPQDDFVSSLVSHEGDAAVRHLFEVVSSLDSMVLGEPQIVSQVKEAYRLAQEHAACGPLTNLLFQRAIAVSARVRSETKLSEGRVSIASVAVGEFGKSIFNRFDDKTVLVIGAGEMAEETLRYLQTEGVQQIVVANRSPERAAGLAETFGGTVAAFDELDTHMAHADVIVSTTGSTAPIVSVERFAAARRNGPGQPVFILDLGAPRDFDGGVGEVDDNVFLYDIDDLRTACDRNRQARSEELKRAATIVVDETDRLMQDVHHRSTGPVIQRLRHEWHNISRRELEQLFRRHPQLGDDEKESIERTLERIVNKLLHPPLETLKDEARDGPPEGLLEAMKRLFQLRD